MEGGGGRKNKKDDAIVYAFTPQTENYPSLYIYVFLEEWLTQ